VKTLADFNLKAKRVLVRCDFNVPLSDKGAILDDFRIRASLPTINYLLKNRARVILMSHLAKPGGKVKEEFRLTAIQEKLLEYLDVSIVKAPDCVGPEIEKWTKEMQEGEILLLENLRFHKEEETNGEDFARALSKLGDIYINDAFAVCHREHASIVGVPKYLASAAGFLLEKEIKILSQLTKNPRTPSVAIVGGAKVETKVGLLNSLSQKVDFVLIGGLIQKELKGKKISLAYPEKIVEPVDQIGGGKDIGLKTRELFQEKITLAKTIFFNGPLGFIEKKEFSKGTERILRAISQSRAFAIIGGGETVEFAAKLGLLDKFSYVSTGGGAMIAFLAGEKLPGLSALK